MGSSDNPDQDNLGSTALLSEILSVLKRIDGHLELQERRISDLDSKFAALSQTKEPEPHIRYIPQPGNPDVLDSSRRGSLPTSSPFATRRDLTVLTSDRNDSVDSRHAPDSIRSVLVHVESPSIYRRGPPPSNPSKAETEGKILSESPKARRKSLVNFGTPSRSGTWNSVTPPPSGLEDGVDEEITESHDLTSYAKFPPPQSWVTRTQGTALEVKYNSLVAQTLWRTYVGDSWTIPPDGRIEMTFQQHILERLDETEALLLLQTLQHVSSKLEYTGTSNPNKRGSFKVKDYEFDPDYELSVAEYRADIPIGQVRRHRVRHRMRSNSIDAAQSAPWKRIIEVRGLSKKLIDEHETWTSNFRNPWNEALPIVDPVCPLLTNRLPGQSDATLASKRIVHSALLHHQRCWRRQPPCDDDLCFHITFYELVDLADENELKGELWRSGKLHSDNEEEIGAMFGVRSRRLRESACTIIVVPDANVPKYWTMLYLCPNSFEQYDNDHDIEQFDTMSAIFKGQDAIGGLDIMIEFTIRMVIERWDKIGEYFAWLIGHRDTLSDPNAHDSLLFDDDSFSRSRKYFWAINYLAELDISISENIVQLERFVKANRTFRQQLTQLRYLRGRLRDQRNEAIALRDGLFSASGVMESRASTRLGENVKLLTFVSIFFLPLSFCMSIWSINDTIFSLKALLIVVFLVGFGTYFIVFNLGTLANLFTKAYSKRKAHLIEQMKNDPTSSWRARGERFVIFQPRHESIQPSEWTIALFIVHRILLLFKRKTAPRDERDSQPRELRTAPIQDVLSWQDIELPTQLSEGKAPTIGAEEAQKRPSLGDSFARFGRAFTFTARRGAMLPPLDSTAR